MTLRRVAAFLTVAALAAVVGSGAYAWSHGVRFYAVESGSMSPAMNAGDLVIDLPTTPTSKYQVGEIVTFHPTPGYITTHRIVAVEADGVSTQGDANSTPDLGQVPPENIVGRVVAVVPFVGRLALFLRQPGGLVALLLVMGFTLWGGWLTWAFLALIIGLGHAEPLNDITPLDGGRRFLGLLTLGLFFLLITPKPF